MHFRPAKIVGKALLAGGWLILIPFWTQGQQELMRSKRWAAGLNVHGGFLAQHKLDSDHLVTGHATGLELLLQKHSTGGKEWEYRYKLPYYGVSLLYYNLGNNPTLGNAWAVMPHVDFRWLYRRLHSGINFRTATGLGYLSNAFDLRENVKNTMIGSRINIAIKFQVDVYRYLNWRNRISAGISLTHFSNAAFAIPNAGINLLGINTTYIHSFGRTQTLRTFDPPIFEKRLHYLIWLGGFLKEVPPVNRGKFPALTLQQHLSYDFKPKSSIGVALDAMYDFSVNDVLDRQGFFTDATTPLRIGLGGVYEKKLGRLSIPFQMMVYLRNFREDQGFVYQRIGLRYQFRSPWVVNLSLKTHFAVADYLELGIGYKFKMK